MIPKIVFQVSKIKQPDYIVDMIKQQLPSDWKYYNYIDGDEVNYFINNPLEEFPDIITKFRSIKLGQHRADLFRYYLLYINGGVYIDSDAMIYTNIENIIKEFEFISVKSIIPHTIFNGFISTTPKHDIIHKALTDAYNVKQQDLDSKYLVLCKNLYDIIYKSDMTNVKLYYEKETEEYGTIATIDDNNIILKHYQLTKVIPKLIVKTEKTNNTNPVKYSNKLKFFLRN